MYEKAGVGNQSPTITADCIGKFRICDGTEDCKNGLDESNCYRWREWSPWSPCQPPTVCMRTRSRVCISGRNLSEVNPNFCYDVDDFYKLHEDPSVEQETEFCPPCIPPPPLTVSPAFARSNPLTENNRKTSVGISNRQNEGNTFTTEENNRGRHTTVTAPILTPLFPKQLSTLLTSSRDGYALSANTKPNYIVNKSTKQSVIMTSLFAETNNIKTTPRSEFSVAFYK